MKEAVAQHVRVIHWSAWIKRGGMSKHNHVKYQTYNGKIRITGSEKLFHGREENKSWGIKREKEKIKGDQNKEGHL